MKSVVFRSVFLAAALALALVSSALADQGYNGSLISNVYQNPASGCGYGFGYVGPGCPYGGYYCSSPGHCVYRAGPNSDGRPVLTRHPSPPPGSR